jgi:hypothetical protein
VKLTVTIARSLISLLGIVLVVLGILFWTGHALSLLSLHMDLGGFFVVCLWVLAALGFVSRATRVFALVVFIWSLLVPALGVLQLQLLPGAGHWIVQAVHLLVGLIAIGLGHGLARRIGRAPAVAMAIPR